MLKLTSFELIIKFFKESSEEQDPKAEKTECQFWIEEEKNKIKRGLNGVYLDRSAISQVNGSEGKLLYRGYNIEELVAKSSFEEVIFLLLWGEMPSPEQLEDLKRKISAHQKLDSKSLSLIENYKDLHPMDLLRTWMSTQALQSPSFSPDCIEELKNEGLKFIAQAPLVVAAQFRFKNGLFPLPAREEFSFAKNFLWMLQGREPQQEEIEIIDKDFIVHAEHSSNASAFSARVVTGAGGNLVSSLVAALATFAGPLHGGAAEGVIQMLREIADVGRVEQYVAQKMEKGEPIIGFGHRVYRVEDPRAPHLRKIAKALSYKNKSFNFIDIVEELSFVLADYEKFGLAPNVDLYTGISYHFLGIPDEFFVALFALARMPGWIAQVIEQRENNVLIRPLLKYDGPSERTLS